MSARVVEWRAARFSDPVARLQFLQRVRASPRRATGRSSLLAVTLGLALASAALVQPVWRHAPTPTPHFTATLHLSQNPLQKPEVAPGRVWMVEANERFELYSNGLQVQNQFVTGTQPRAYLAFLREGIDSRPAKLRFDPAGIVFHTTESHMAPFEEDQNGTLRRAGEGLLEYVRRNHSYHFVIDRFGRVFRIVRESDYANHAGHSVWADQTWVYVNLNESFFGVAFEAKSRPEDRGQPVNAAQVHAARILIEMLRARYRIAAANCVAHAQVSVNPSNRQAGYHTDWGADLPFDDLGLSDNYQRPLPSVTLFGFNADSLLADPGGIALRPALAAAVDQVRQEAVARGLPLDRYREILQRRYKDASASSGRLTNVKY
jgi:hypothetical protein